MVGVAGYNIIERKIIIENPFQFYYELKNTSINEMTNRLTFGVNNNKSDFFKQILNYLNDNDYPKLFLTKNASFSNSLNELNLALKVLMKQGLINGNYKVKLNANKKVVEMEIFSINITNNGKEVLKSINEIENEDTTLLIKQYIEKCKKYILEIDIMSISKKDLIINFKNILEEITNLKILDFSININSDIKFDIYLGKIEIHNKKAFVKFINSRTIYQLESKLKQFFSNIIIKNTEIKIILNAIKINNFENILLFMTKDVYISNLLYLALNDYIKLNMKYEMENNFEIKINNVSITEKGEKYFNNKNIIGFKKNKRFSMKYAKALKKSFIKAEKNNSSSKAILEDLLASKYLQ